MRRRVFFEKLTLVLGLLWVSNILSLIIRFGKVFGGVVVVLISVPNGLCSTSAPRSPRELKLHTQYFTKWVVSLSVGFPCESWVEDGFVRCQLCGQDLMIQNCVFILCMNTERVRAISWLRSDTGLQMACLCSSWPVSLLELGSVRNRRH